MPNGNLNGNINNLRQIDLSIHPDNPQYQLQQQFLQQQQQQQQSLHQNIPQNHLHHLTPSPSPFHSHSHPQHNILPSYNQQLANPIPIPYINHINLSNQNVLNNSNNSLSLDSSNPQNQYHHIQQSLPPFVSRYSSPTLPIPNSNLVHQQQYSNSSSIRPLSSNNNSLISKPNNLRINNNGISNNLPQISAQLFNSDSNNNQQIQQQMQMNSMMDMHTNTKVPIDYNGINKLTYDISQNMLIPPFANLKIAKNSMKFQQPKRSKRKSKFSKEQDEIIISMKKNGKSWVEIAEATNVDTYLAARNRYQVLIGQQGGGNSECGPTDVFELRSIVDEGELEKLRYLSKEFKKSTGKSCSERQIRELIRYLFWKDPGKFDVNQNYLIELIKLQELRIQEMGDRGRFDGNNDINSNENEIEINNNGIDDEADNEIDNSNNRK